MKFIDDVSKANLKRFLKLLLKYKKQWAFAGFLLLTITLMKLPMPLLTGYIIDNVIVKKNAPLLNYISGGLIAVTIVYLLLNFLNDYLLFRLNNFILIKIRLMLFEHLQKLPISIIHSKETGYLLARVLNETSTLNGLFFQNFFNLAQNVITLVVGTVVILSINWKLALLSLSILPFFASSNFLFINKIKYWNNKIKEQQAIISKELSESLRAIKVTKLFGLYNRMAVNFLKNMKTEFVFSKKEFKYGYIVSLTSSFFAALGPLIVIWYGGYEVINGNLSIGQLVAFSSLLAFLYNPTKSILNYQVTFQKSIVSLNRIYDVLNMDTEKKLSSALKSTISTKSYEIEFKNVSFGYNGSESFLNNINLKIKDKEKIAILGPTGAGKSTLLHLLAHFYEPNKGSIHIAGRNINEIPLNQLRKYIGFVSQEDFLFSTSIFNNIKMGDINAQYDDIVEATKLANAYQFIRSLPNGFDSRVGEQGEFLSGGQKQLICLARLILKNPPILILDEPTSAIDSKTEALMQESLKFFMKGRLAIIVSHRLSSVLDVDRIVILENGEISAIGTHKELLLENKFYKSIFSNQVISLVEK